MLPRQKWVPCRARGPIFSTRLCIGGQRWPTQSQPRHFRSGAQRQPRYLHPLGAPTHLPLSRPFCCRRTYLVRSLQEVTSQEEIFMPDISGYIRERVKSIYMLRSMTYQVTCLDSSSKLASTIYVNGCDVAAGSMVQQQGCVH